MKQHFLVLLQALPPNRLLRHAGELAQTLNCSLDALYVCEPMAPIVTELLTAERPDLDTVRAAGQQFKEWSESTRLSSARWLAAEGHVVDVLKRTADWHDLLILQRDDGSSWGLSSAIGTLIVELNMPVLVLPSGYANSARLETVIIAWNGTPEATRALHCALPFLRKARRCLLLRGQPSRTLADANQELFDLDDYLKRNGVVVEALPMPDSAHLSAERLFEWLVESQADLLVMGGYGRSQFSEWLFGGLTRSVLEACPIPVLMRH